MLALLVLGWRKGGFEWAFEVTDFAVVAILGCDFWRCSIRDVGDMRFEEGDDRVIEGMNVGGAGEESCGIGLLGEFDERLLDDCCRDVLVGFDFAGVVVGFVVDWEVGFVEDKGRAGLADEGGAADFVAGVDMLGTGA